MTKVVSVNSTKEEQLAMFTAWKMGATIEINRPERGTGWHAHKPYDSDMDVNEKVISLLLDGYAMSDDTCDDVKTIKFRIKPKEELYDVEDFYLHSKVFKPNQDTDRKTYRIKPKA